MRVVIAGGHGKIALILERLLSERGDSAAGCMAFNKQVPFRFPPRDGTGTACAGAQPATRV